MSKEFKYGDKLIHKSTMITGFFIKDYYPTGGVRTLQIQCNDGRIFYAPYNQFVRSI